MTHVFKQLRNPKSHLLPILIVVVITLAGYYRAFTAANVFLDDDHVSISGYSYGNSLGNGWRPEKGVGTSAFFGDGIWHPWSVFSLLERVAPSREDAFKFSIVFLGILGAITEYFFLRKILGQNDPWLAILLAPLIIFSTDQSGYQYMRLSISEVIGIPLIILLLYDYYQKPKWVHFGWAGLLFWFVMGFGNLWSLTQVMTLGLFFTVTYLLYFKESLSKMAVRWSAIYAIGAIIFGFLSAWMLYSFFAESFLVGYAREKIFMPRIDFRPDLKGILDSLIGLIFVQWLPLDHNIAGIGDKVFWHIYNVLAVFPFIFLFFIFNKAKNFWEYSLKILVVVFIAHSVILRGNLLPGYRDLYLFLNTQTSKIITMYDFTFSLEVGLIAIFLARMSPDTVVLKNRLGRILQIIIASILVVFFSGLSLVAFLAIFFPGALPEAIHTLIVQYLPAKIGEYPREFIEAVGAYNIARFQEVMRWEQLAFYASSALLVLPFLRNKWLMAVSKKSKLLIAVLLLCNGLFYSWAVYPLTSTNWFWKRDDVRTLSLEPTDRFYFLKIKGQWTLESFKKKYSEIEGGGYRERFVGVVEPPALNFCGVKSFDSKMVHDFTYYILNGEGANRLPILKLYYGGPLFSSSLLDMCAVKYYYAEDELKELPPNLTLYAKFKQLYIYKSNTAWPYFYLAERLDLKKENEHLKNVQRGTAYLEKKDMFVLPRGAGKAKIALRSFSYGQMVFDYTAKDEEFLTVADSWHPNWKAKIENVDMPVLRANEVFKGIRLPAGQHEVTLYFDTTPYRPGIYISVVAWVLFLIGFYWVGRQREKSILRI